MAPAALIYALVTAGAGSTTAVPMLDPFSGAVVVRQFGFELDEDADYDQFPDDWTRRRGPEFPSYLKIEIDRAQGRGSRSSLRIAANGGAAAIYSPPISIDAKHSWLLEAAVRTQRLHYNAAVVSISFIDQRWQRIQRVLTKAVSGTHQGWCEVRIGPISPPAGARYAVIGCHLVGGKKSDIEGDAWFDGLRLLKLPQMQLISNFQTHFRHRSAEVEVMANVGGLDDGPPYDVRLQIQDSGGNLLLESTRPLVQERSAMAELPGVAIHADPGAGSTSDGRESVSWKLPPFDYGYYEIRAELRRSGTAILEARTSFAVLDLVDEPIRGEFGWSVESGAAAIPLRELSDIAIQSGISWLKLPLWQSVYDVDKEKPGQVVEFFDRLSHRGITPVGLLSDPPDALRSKFVRNWSGISEVFKMPAKFWSPSLAPVLARYSSTIRHWQLGGDADESFAGMNRFTETIEGVKTEFDQIGRDTQIGVHWDWSSQWPAGKLPSSLFLSLGSREPMPPDETERRLKTMPKAAGSRWATIRPLAKSQFPSEERAADLVKQMVAARIGGADAIFAADILHPEHGILNGNGAPTRLYLPWRTTAVALQGTEYLGAFDLESGATNHVFVRGGEMRMVLWSDTPTTESIYLGENVVASDIFGRQQTIPVDPKTGTQKLTVGPMPLTIRGGSEPIALWRLAAKFEKGRVPSAYGEHRDAIVGRNPFPQGANGVVTVIFPSEWAVEPSSWTMQVGTGENFRFPMTLTLPPNANLGRQDATIQFDIVADRPYRFRVLHHYEVGLGDIDLKVTDRRLPDGRLEIEQLITNKTDPTESLNFRCSLFVPNEKRQILFVTKLGRGDDRKIYHLANAEALKGKELWIRAEQVDGRRVLNHRWKVGAEGSETK